jgi:hypothetical protein
MYRVQFKTKKSHTIYPYMIDENSQLCIKKAFVKYIKKLKEYQMPIEGPYYYCSYEYMPQDPWMCCKLLKYKKIPEAEEIVKGILPEVGCVQRLPDEPA